MTRPIYILSKSDATMVIKYFSRGGTFLCPPVSARARARQRERERENRTERAKNTTQPNLYMFEGGRPNSGVNLIPSFRRVLREGVNLDGECFITLFCLPS